MTTLFYVAWPHIARVTVFSPLNEIHLSPTERSESATSVPALAADAHRAVNTIYRALRLSVLAHRFQAKVFLFCGTGECKTPDPPDRAAVRKDAIAETSVGLDTHRGFLHHNSYCQRYNGR